MPKLAGGHLIAQYLVEEGVSYVFGVSGHGNVGLLNALYEYQDNIKTISVHHEQVAGHMADAYFRVKHQPVMVTTSTGPGTTNLPNSLATALMDSSAFLALTANVPTSQFNHGPFQELNRHFQAETSVAFRPFVKQAFNATNLEMLPTTLRLAFKSMLTGRPGPVQLDVPFNLFLEEDDLEVPDPNLWRRGISNRTGASPDDIRNALYLLLNAERPLILVGHGVVLSEGAAELRKLAEILNIPVVQSSNGKGVVDSRTHFSLGGVGRNGSFTANRASSQCDVLLAIGTRFDDRMSSSWLPGYTFNIPPTHLIHVDIDYNEISRNFPATLGIQADAKTMLEQMLDEVGNNQVKPSGSYKEWWTQIEEWHMEWQEHIMQAQESDAVPIRPERLMSEMRKVIPEDAIVVPDSGAHHNWMVQFWDTYCPGTLIQTVGYASMGFGVCGVLGAKLAAPDNVCLAVVGDGGMLMTPQAIPTAVEYNIPVVWLVWNDYGYGAIRGLQLSTWGREYTTSFLHQDTGQTYKADLCKMAEAFGAGAARVENPDDIGDVIESAIASDRPYLIDIVIDPKANAPTVGSWHLPPLPPAQPSFPPN